MSTSDLGPHVAKVVDVSVLGSNNVSPETLELTSGMHIRWTNRTNHVCEISFADPSPFNGHTLVYEIPPGGVVISDYIRDDAPKASLAYVVKTRGFEETGAEHVFGLRSPILSPTVIIRGPY
jgi:hypothetical protein